MDENTRFLVERMDAHHEILRDEIKAVRDELALLKEFKSRVMGMAVGASMVVSLGVGYISELIRGG